MAITTTTVVSSIHGHVPELDLSALHLQTSVVERFNETVPGLRTSAAFLTFLRANLALDPTINPSPANPLQSSPYTITSTSTTTTTTTSSSSSSSIPSAPITISSLASSSPAQTAGLHLIGTSILADRTRATHRLARHPILLCGLFSVFGISHHFLPTRDLASVVILVVVVVTIHLALARGVAGGCFAGIGADGLGMLGFSEGKDKGNGGERLGTGSGTGSGVLGGEEDLVVGAMSTEGKEKLIGAMVLRFEPFVFIPMSSSSTSTSSTSSTTNATPSSSTMGGSSPSPSGQGQGQGHRRHKSRGSIGSLKALQRRGGGRCVIRAWTVNDKYRGQGVGTDLLNEAVRLAREKMGKDAQVGFAKEHANSTRVLPEWLDGDVRRTETRAGLALREVLRHWEGKGKRW